MGSATVKRQPKPHKLSLTSKFFSRTRSLLTCHELNDLRIYRGDWLLCLAENLKCTKAGTLFLVYSAFFLGAKLLIARLSGTLYFSDWSLVPQDLHRFPPFGLLVNLFRGPLQVDAPNPAVIPYLRDYSDIVVMILMAAHMALVHRQWKDISIAAKHLSTKPVLNPAVVSRAHVGEVISKYDRWMNRDIIRVLSRIAAVGAVALFYYSFAHAGIYSGLNIPYVSGWEKAAYTNWCENPILHPAFFLYSAFVASFVMYYMIRHNVVGVFAVLMCKDILGKGANGSKPLLRLDPDDRDGMGGLRLLRDIMYRVYLSIIIMGLALIMIYYRVGTHTAAALVPLYAIFFCCNPFYIFVPLHYIGKNIRIAKEEKLEQLDRERVRIVAHSGDTYRIEKHIATISDIPDYLFSRRRLMSFTIVYVVPWISIGISLVDILAKNAPR